MFNFYPPYTSTLVSGQVSLIWAINDRVGAKTIFVSSSEPKSVDVGMFYHLCRQSAPHMHRIDRKDHSVYITFSKVTCYCVSFDCKILGTARPDDSLKSHCT